MLHSRFRPRCKEPEIDDHIVVSYAKKTERDISFSGSMHMLRIPGLSCPPTLVSGLLCLVPSGHGTIHCQQPGGLNKPDDRWVTLSRLACFLHAKSRDKQEAASAIMQYRGIRVSADARRQTAWALKNRVSQVPTCDHRIQLWHLEARRRPKPN